MRILFTGGGTGGHFYPIIAVAEAIRGIEAQQSITGLELVYVSDDPFDLNELKRFNIRYVQIKTGKIRTYASIQNFFDLFRTFFALIQSVFKLFVLYPDVVLCKGGYASFPTVFAARLLRIPVIAHESDIVPGRVTTWIAPYAEKIAIAYPEVAELLPHKNRIALTGIPLRKEAILQNEQVGEADTIFALEPSIPILLVLGGSQGAEIINENIMDSIVSLVDRYQIIHQTGSANFDWMKQRASDTLSQNPHASRYKPYPFLDLPLLRLAGSCATLVISRAGSMIFEIAIWKKPSIIIPLAIARGDHQRANAYSYAHSGAAVVIEEQNLKPLLLVSIIDKLITQTDQLAFMAESTKAFTHVDAANIIATALIDVVIRHEHE